MGVAFFKMQGAGNDFIVVDNRKGAVGDDPAAFARTYCPRRKAVGADGVLLIEPSSTAAFRMRLFNADGSEAEMCGNGARCVARFAHLLGIAPEQMRFETMAGPIDATVADGDVTIGMGEVTDLGEPMAVEAAGGRWVVHSALAGVPHAVIYVGNADSADVDGVGRAVRLHEHFQPKGTNVNFVQVVGPAHIRVRTYERGVEAETLACGTGSIASAVITHLRKDIGEPPVRVDVEGGHLRIGFRADGERVVDVTLTGDAEVVYRGTLD